MSKRRFWLILSFSIILGIAMGFFIFKTFIISDAYSIDMYLNVGNTTSINVDTDAIHFATLRPGSGATKLIMIANDDRSRKIGIKAYGEFKDWLSYDRIIVIGQNQEKEAAITVNVPADAEYGQYKGKLKVNFYR